MTKREVARKPSRMTANRVMGRDGGLVANAKSRRLSLDEMEAELARLGKGCPKIDTLALHQEGE